MATCSSPSPSPSPLLLLAFAAAVAGVMLAPAAGAGRSARPRHGHLAFADECGGTGVRVMWNTDTEGDTSRISWVQVGLSEDRLDRNFTSVVGASGVPATYSASSLCAAPPGLVVSPPGTHHDVLIDDCELLAAGARLFYRYGSDADGWSDVRAFRAPAPAGARGAFGFVVYQDMDATPQAAATAELMGREFAGADPPAFVWHAGDLAYGQASTEKWNAWMELIEPYATLAPYMVGVGNHEYGYTCPCTDNHPGACASHDPTHPDKPGGYRPLGAMFGNDSSGECGVPTWVKFRMPRGGPGSMPPFYYSFSYGNAHFVTLSSEHSLEAGSRQLAWLQGHLRAGVDRARTPWLFVSIHRPLYSTMIVPPQWVLEVRMRRTLEPLLAEHEVAVLFAGHLHTYERTCPLRHGSCSDTGTVHVIAGTGGAHLHTWYRWPFGGRLLNYLDGHGYGTMRVLNETVGQFEFHSADGRVFDSVTIVNPYRGAPG